MNLKNLSKTQEQTESLFKVYLAYSMARLGQDFQNINETCKDILQEHNSVSIETLREAIKKGSSGDYGRTFKLCTQEVLIWIRKYLEELKGTKTEQIKAKIKSDYIIPKKLDLSNNFTIDFLDKVLFKALTPIGNKTLYDFYDEDILMIVKIIKKEEQKQDKL